MGRFFSGSFTNHRFIFSQGEHHESHQTRTSSSPASRGALRMSPDRNRMRRAAPSGSARYPHLRRSIAVPNRKTPENHPAHAGTRSGAETYRLAKTTGRLRSGTEYETPTGENPVGAFFFHMERKLQRLAPGDASSLEVFRNDAETGKMLLRDARTSA